MFDPMHAGKTDTLEQTKYQLGKTKILQQLPNVNITCCFIFSFTVWYP
jgi:hypothetical protein